MTNSKIWIGTLGHMRWAPCPQQGMTSSNNGYAETMRLQSGGAVAVRSAQYSKSYSMEMVGRTGEMEGVDFYSELARGKWDGPQGTDLDLIHFNNPYDYQRNILPPVWATPGLMRRGWYDIFDGEINFSSYGLHPGFNQMNVSADFTLSGPAFGAKPQGKALLTLVIPPTHTLHIGFTGEASFTGQIVSLPILAGEGSAYGPRGTVPLINPLIAFPATWNPLRMNTSFDGATYKAVQFWIDRSSATTSIVSLLSGMAQLWPTGTTPPLTGNHIDGNGHTGCLITNGGIAEDYIYMHPPRKGISLELTEVGAWRRRVAS